MSTVFPYDNKDKPAEVWAGRPETKSSSWIVAYHSGISFYIGKHSFLFFGKESLSAAIVSMNVIGIDIDFSPKAKRVIARDGGVSTVPDPLDRLKQAKQINDEIASQAERDNIKSAEQLYNAIIDQGMPLSVRNPFSLDDLEGASGEIMGAKADIIIGSAEAYLIRGTKTTYFIIPHTLFNWSLIRNISDKLTLVGVSGTAAGGVMTVEKKFNLFEELTKHPKDEQPFLGYAVHKYFQDYKAENLKGINGSKINSLFIGEGRTNMRNTFISDGSTSWDVENSLKNYDKLHYESLGGDFTKSPYWPWLSEQSRQEISNLWGKSDYYRY